MCSGNRRADMVDEIETFLNERRKKSKGIWNKLKRRHQRTTGGSFC